MNIRPFDVYSAQLLYTFGFKYKNTVNLFKNVLLIRFYFQII